MTVPQKMLATELSILVIGMVVGMVITILVFYFEDK
jgi:hypothetical protein